MKIADFDKPELALLPGMVYQIWEDGEVTVQKSGELLWQRTLHCDFPGEEKGKLQLAEFPHKEEQHAFIWVAPEDIKTVLREFFGRGYRA